MGCIICGSEERELIEKGIRYDPGGQIWKCKECGFIYLWPQPTAKTLEDYYEGEYRREKKSRLPYKRFDRGLWEAERRWSMIGESPDRILEIGSGAGSFIYVSNKTKGDRTTGIELDKPSREFLEQCYKIKVYPGLGKLPDQKFDMIVMFHVLEHLADPVLFLKVLQDRLKLGGTIIIEVPNVDDKMLGNVRYRKEYFFQKAHLWYFSRCTLAKLLQKAGLTADISYYQRYNLKAHLRWIFKGRNNGDGNQDDLQHSNLGKLYAAMLRRVGTADTLWAVARGIK